MMNPDYQNYHVIIEYIVKNLLFYCDYITKEHNNILFLYLIVIIFIVSL